MAPHQFYQMTTERGDEVTLSVIEHDDRATVLLSFDDVDELTPPTIELTIQEFLTLSEMVVRHARDREEVAL